MKSQVDIYVDLLERMLCCNPCNLSSEKSLHKDISVMKQRYQSEGLSFLTKTLPLLGKALDLGLSSTTFSRPREFSRSHDSSSRPAFMQAYFKVVFDDDGVLRDEVEPDVVKHLRQVLFFAYKLEVPYSEKQVSESFDSFCETDMSLELITDVESLEILDVASYITEDVFVDFNHKDILPKHGPGAVATGETLDDKWEFSRLYNSVHQVYPYYDYYITGGGNELIDRKEWYMNLVRLDYGQAKLIAVPKDSRGPRLISCEPLEIQWIQQGLGRKLMQHLETFKFTKGRINFIDQSVNQALAIDSSIDQYYATIDLKDASDRVSTNLVQHIFKRCPDLLRALEACRSRETKLPDGRVVTLNKYAPMGSALCFPVEAYCFWVILVSSISRHYKMRQANVMKEVFVYGDDIIIPSAFSSLCMQSLEAVNLRVNKSKCCIHGPFRESCGVDAFNGVNVTPVRLKKLWSGRKSDGSAYASYISVANTLQQRGYSTCAQFLWEKIESVYGLIPYGTSRSSIPCRLVSSPEKAELINSKLFQKRYSRRYQRLEFRLNGLSTIRRKTKLDGWQRLLRNNVTRSTFDPSTVVVPRSTLIKRRWIAIN